MARATGLLVFVLLTAFAAAGCGGDSGSASSSPPISRAEFAKQANAACREEKSSLSERIAGFKLRIAGEKPRPYADLVHFVFLPMVEREVSDIEAVDWPKKDAEGIDAMRDGVRTAIDAVAVMPRVPSIAAARRHFIQADKQLRAYGLFSCVVGS
jgi:hypothetical protein